MKQVIELAALVEDLGSEAMVEEKLRLSAENGQIRVEVEGWQSRFEVPTDQLIQAIQSLTLLPTAPPVSLTMVTHLGQKLSRLEQQIAAQPHQRLELEAMGESLEALRREVLPRLVVVESWKERIELAEDTIAEHHNALSFTESHFEQLGNRIALLENNLAEPPAETAAMALYGGEQ